MKRSLLALLACLFLASASFAQQNPADAPASKADIEKYFAIMRTRDMAKTMMDNMSNQARQRLKERIQKQPGMTPEEQERAVQMETDLFKNLPFDEIIDAMIPIYQQHFTKGDMDTLVAFYSTPTGQKLLNELPSITKEAMQVVMPIIQKTVADAEKRMDDQLAQMQKQTDPNQKKQAQQN
jgi:hypothetical protein